MSGMATTAAPPSYDEPLFDGSQNILQMISHHREKNPTHPVFRFAHSDGQLRDITWKECSQAFDTATRFVLKHVQKTALENAGSDKPPVIGILANLDSITYYTLVVGIMNAGFTVFPISNRNSADGVAHLLSATGCDTLFTSDDAPTQRLTDAALAMHKEKDLSGPGLNVVKAPLFDELYVSGGDQEPLPPRVINDQASTPCVIIHSSGTVSFPKPITLTYKMFFEHSNLIRLEGDLRGVVISAHAVPLYHLMGLKSIGYSVILGVTLAVFRPSSPPTLPKSDLVLQEAALTHSTRIFCAPAFLESWAKDLKAIEALKKYDAVMFGGGPVQESVGNQLAKEGVTLVPMLGLTEVGSLTSFFPKHTHTEGWAWFALDPRIEFEFIREEGQEEVYRFIVKQSEFKTPAVINTTIDGRPAYDTGDLFLRHPTNHNLWKIHGRADAQIMHSTGEKTNPAPIEMTLKNSPYISDAMMIGRARFQAGVIVVPSAHIKVDLSDKVKVEEYISLIWSTVEKANRQAPQHSRIFREMVMIANPEKPFEYTAKGSLRRQVTVQKYEEEIERLYGTQDAEHAPEEADKNGLVSLEEITAFVQRHVRTILGPAVGDTDDFFKSGADSLCALSINNNILRDLQKSQLMSHQSCAALPKDLLYLLPSISKLSTFLYGAVFMDKLNAKTVKAAAEEAKPVVVEEKKAVPHPGSAEGWQALLQSKDAVVQIINDPNGDPPLIILPGSPGTIGPLRPLTILKTGIWGVQFTDDAPQTSLEALAGFYRQKIKEKQPTGPYRFASYSGSCTVLVELVHLFEAGGDEVIQFVMLDHFPTIFLEQVEDLANAEIDNPQWWDPHARSSLEGIYNLFQNTQGVMGVIARRGAQELRDVLDGMPGTPWVDHLIDRSTKLTRMTLKYLLSERFTVEDANGQRRWEPKLFREFVSSIKARLTIYVATGGIRQILPAQKKARLESDLGSREFFPDVMLIEVEGGHLDFLGNPRLLKGVQTDYLKL